MANEVRDHRKAIALHEAELARAAQLRQQAADLESAIAATSETAATPEEVAAAEAVRDAANEKLAKAIAAKARADHEEKVEVERTRLTEANEKAGQLTGMVDRFTKVVPNELLKASNGIPGLAFDGDEIFLDGVAFSSLSGREAIFFATEIARRLNVQSKILIVDGLERVDDDQLPDFVKMATADGYQLIGTRVEAGEVVLTAIEADDAPDVK